MVSCLQVGGRLRFGLGFQLRAMSCQLRVFRLPVAGLLIVLLCGLRCDAQGIWPLWEAYTQKFVDTHGRVIDHGRGEMTTSEGQAYAMFFALVAGDRTRFDKLVEWTTDNLAQGDLTARLPAWSWGKAQDGTWRVLDRHSAADADLWMAYALCEAGRLWKSPRYEKMGTSLAARVTEQEVVKVPGVGAVLLPGPEGFHPDAKSWFVNPSYAPPELLAYFAKRDPAGPWKDVLASLPAVLHTNGGFAMDWMTAGPGGLRASLPPGISAVVPMGSYDAIRVYLWLGMADPKTDGVRQSMAAMKGMAEYLKGHTFPPEFVTSAGKDFGGNAPVGFSAAVIPFLRAEGMRKEEQAQQNRLVALRNDKSGLYGKEAAYYDQNLALFATGWVEERFRFEADGRLRLKWN